MRYSRIMLLAIVSLLLVSCSLSRPATERRSYLLQSAPDSMAPGPFPASIRIAPVTVSPAFEGKCFIYRTGEQSFETDFYNEFLIAPRSMMTGYLINWLQARGLFKEVHTTGTYRRADFLLDSHINAIYGDFRTPASPTATVEIRWTLSSQGNNGAHEQLLARTLREKISLAEPSAEALAMAYDTALYRIMQQLEQDMLPHLRKTAGNTGKVERPSNVAEGNP